MPEHVPHLEVDLVQDSPIGLDAHFTCAPGQILALVGPSGSGKSTILKAIAGLYRPKNGRVAIGGREWLNTSTKVNVPARGRSVGVVFQDYALFPHLTALSNIMEAMLHIPSGERKAKASALLARVNLAGLEDRRPAQLSGGQQQRVAVARALARDPSVLLLDEPFSAVDQVTKERLYEELAALHQELSIPIVLVTHALTEAVILADQMCVLHRGRTLQLAAPTDVMNKPASAQVAKLVALRNVFAGEVAGHQDGKATQLRWGPITLEMDFYPNFRIGEKVSWTIPESHVVMHRLEKSSRPTNENLVEGTIISAVTLGGTTHIKMRSAVNDKDSISFSVPSHFARLNRANVGKTITVSLLKSGLHLMKAA